MSPSTSWVLLTTTLNSCRFPTVPCAFASLPKCVTIVMPHADPRRLLCFTPWPLFLAQDTSYTPIWSRWWCRGNRIGSTSLAKTTELISAINFITSEGERCESVSTVVFDIHRRNKKRCHYFVWFLFVFCPPSVRHRIT